MLNLSIPKIGTRFYDEQGNVSREWYLFLSGLLQVLGGPNVLNDITPVTVMIASSLQSLSWDKETDDTEQPLLPPFRQPSLTVNSVVLGNGTGDLLSTSALTDGQIVIGGSQPQARTVTGDVTLSSVGVMTVTANAITNAKLAQMTGLTLKGNNSTATLNASDLTVTQVNTLLQTVTSWTPADGSGAALSFSGVSANYTQRGNMVFAYATLTYPATADGTAAKLQGLPVAVPNQNYAQVPSVVSATASITGGLVLVPIANTSTAKFDVGSPFGAVTNLQLSGATLAFILIYPAS